MRAKQWDLFIPRSDNKIFGNAQLTRRLLTYKTVLKGRSKISYTTLIVVLGKFEVESERVKPPN